MENNIPFHSEETREIARATEERIKALIVAMEGDIEHYRDLGVFKGAEHRALLHKYRDHIPSWPDLHSKDRKPLAEGMAKLAQAMLQLDDQGQSWLPNELKGQARLTKDMVSDVILFTELIQFETESNLRAIAEASAFTRRRQPSIKALAVVLAIVPLYRQVFLLLAPEFTDTNAKDSTDAKDSEDSEETPLAEGILKGVVDHARDTVQDFNDTMKRAV